jgi:hypothetical protein
VYSK